MKTLTALRSQKSAFTLIEIMLVIIIIVALMAVLLPNLQHAMGDAKQGQAEIYITQIKGSLAQYEMMNNIPPSTSQGLRALIEMPSGEPHPRKWRAMMDKIEPDPWGVNYFYEFPGKHNPKGFDIFSAGPDRQPHTDDDVGNWEK